MAPATMKEWHLSGAVSRDKSGLPSSSYDAAIAYKIYRFNRVRDLEQTPEMRKAEIFEILERVDLDRKIGLEMDKIFAALNAENQKSKRDGVDGQEAGPESPKGEGEGEEVEAEEVKAEEGEEGEGALSFVPRVLRVERNDADSWDYLRAWLGITGSVDEEVQKETTGVGLGDPVVEGAEEIEEDIINRVD